MKKLDRNDPHTRNDIVGHVPESCCGVSIDGAVQLACIIDAVYRSNNCGFVAVE